MIWGETHEQYQVRVTTKHRWFAWHPVWLKDGRGVWLQYVIRYRGKYDGELALILGTFDDCWTYELPTEELP